MNRLYIILAFLCVGLTCCSSKSEKGPEAKTDQVQSVSDVPNLPLTFADGSKKFAKDLPGKIALILFQPDCDHCQREAQDIQKHLDAFKDTKLYFVSSSSMQEMTDFAKAYGLAQSPNVVFARTEVQDVLNAYGPIDAPSLYLYSSEGKLIQAFNGEVAIEVVVKYL
jgi:peroxiredoxin